MLLPVGPYSGFANEMFANKTYLEKNISGF